jgi:hypothetical protein
MTQILLMNSQSQKKLGEKNPQWKGNEVGYYALHDWIRRRKIKPELCEDCKNEPPYDLANISGKYLRDINDYKWVCRRCHMLEDGRGKDINLYAPDNRGSKNGQSKLNEKKIKKIRGLLDEGINQTVIAKLFNVNRITINDIKSKRRWGWLE